MLRKHNEYVFHPRFKQQPGTITGEAFQMYGPGLPFRSETLVLLQYNYSCRTFQVVLFIYMLNICDSISMNRNIQFLSERIVFLPSHVNSLKLLEEMITSL